MSLREQNKHQLIDQDFDTLVIGGGINGAAAAAALAARGIRTALVDARDFAGLTSQSSSNLIWGGIKYLESLEGGLVRGLCRGRNELIRAYPAAVRETRFLATLPRGLRRPRTAVWLGSWLYWFLGDRFTRPPTLLSANDIRRREPAVNVSGAAGGVEYSDAVLVAGDARFVFNLVHDAMAHGCVAVNYLRVTDLAWDKEGHWEVDLRDQVTGDIGQVRARVVVNAAGPFADDVARLAGVRHRHRHVLSKGIHLVVDRVTSSGRVLAFISDDNRPFFVVPLGSRSCIGTTDTPTDHPDGGVTEEDRRFVLDNANRCLRLAAPLTEADVIAERCGVRPLAVVPGEYSPADYLQLSRRHAIEAAAGKNFVTVFGGKLSDCIKVGNGVVKAVLDAGVADPGLARRWYGEPDDLVRQQYRSQAKVLNGALSQVQLERFWCWYGLRALELLETLQKDPGAACPVLPGSDIVRAEVELIRTTEMVVTIDDFLRRRTLLALTVNADHLASSVAESDLDQILFD